MKLQFVTFDLGFFGRPLVMALNVQKVKEVTTCEFVQESSELVPGLLGIYNFKNTPIPVLDMLSLLTKGAKVQPEIQARRLVICDLNNLWLAIPVESTGRLITCNSEDFLPPPVKTQNSVRTISGLIRHDKKFTPVLDLDSLIETAGFQPVKPLNPPQTKPTYPGYRVLVVDDSPTLLKKLIQVFRGLGCEVISATNGREGIEALEKCQFQVDLIFTDIEMPILNGIQMVKELKANPKGEKIPVLFNSALSNPMLISDITTSALGQYLVKFDEDLILKHIEMIFSAKQAAA